MLLLLLGGCESFKDIGIYVVVGVEFCVFKIIYFLGFIFVIVSC